MSRPLVRLVAAVTGACTLAACTETRDAPRPADRLTAPSSSPTPRHSADSTAQPPGSTPQRLRAGRPEVLATNLDAPWGLAFLPDGTALVSERDTRRIARVDRGGRTTSVQTIGEADAGGEGGLLGIAVAPTYAQDRLVYAFYTTAEDNRIARFRLGERPQPIVTGIPVSGIHNGGRLAFGPDGMLYAGTGDASERGLSQDRRSLGGKVLRMTPEGKPAPGNPFPGSLVFTLGHRNVQGIGFDDAGRVYATEFGQNAFDEVNLLRAGQDYGWPGVEGDETEAGSIRPLLTWRPSEASPSGAVVAGGSLWVAALRGKRLWQVPLDGRGGISEPVALLRAEFGRLRHVGLEPGGAALWLLTSNRDGRGSPQTDDDRIIRVPLIPA